MFERLSECMLCVPHPCLMPMEAGKGALDSAGTGVTVASRHMDDGIWNRCPLQKQQELSLQPPILFSRFMSHRI